MRDLHQELRQMGLTNGQCSEILDWVNTLTNQDLIDNGSKFIIGPPGDGGYSEEFVEPTTEELIHAYIAENLPCWKRYHNKSTAVSDTFHRWDGFRGRMMTLREAKDLIDKVW